MKSIQPPQLFQYQGSKRHLAPYILQYFPAHMTRLVEPFCGTGAVSIRAAMNNQAESFWLNDINQALVNLLKECIMEPVNLYKKYQTYWKDQFLPGTDPVSYYYELRDLFNTEPDPGLTLFIFARITKGSIRYNSKGEMNQGCDKRRCGTTPDNILKRSILISNLLKEKTVFSCVDYREVLEELKPSDDVYLDPPFSGTTFSNDRRYIQGIDPDELIEELHSLNKRRIRYILSYDGQTGNKSYGSTLPESLGLKKIELPAVRSAQATILGKIDETVEVIYLSPELQKEHGF